jgi:aminoglycoside phosphotransferase (APT) family kinase protein
MDGIDVYALLAQLSGTAVSHPRVIDGWLVSPLVGGTNNLLYRSTNAESDVVIKWCIHDARQRAMREYAALTLVHAVAPECAPVPILVDETQYHQPVVVQAYVDGRVLTAPPADDDEWHDLIACFVTIHGVSMRDDPSIHPAVINADSVAAARQMIRMQLEVIPADAWPSTLREIVRALDATIIAELPPASLTLCHVDSNHRNFIRTNAVMVVVDWENGGWGDPTFEIAELIAHPAYLVVPPNRWEWVIDTYCRMMGNPDMRHRIETHLRIYRVWWVARFARYLYEVPRQLDQRLVARDANWLRDIQNKYDRYLNDAWAGLALVRRRDDAFL